MTTSTGHEATESARRQGAVPTDTLAHRLMLVRAHAGNLTIKEAAAKCGLNYGSWSNWERGSRPLDLVDVVEAIAHGLVIDRDWLLFGGQLTDPRRPREPVRSVADLDRRDVGPNQRSVRVAERPMPQTPRCAPDVRSPSIGGIHRRPKARGLAVQPIAA